MSDVASTLRAGGLVLVDPVIEGARLVGLPLPDAAALSEKESRAQMIWGHDPVDTGGTYTKGGPVTVENYWAYRHHPTAGWQGVGITQLTYKGFIYQAEQLHPAAGAADPVTNCRVGFKALLDLQRQYGDQDGARRYNGSGPPAEAYGRDFIARRDAWRQRLDGAAPAPAPADGRPELHEGDESDLIWRLQQWMKPRFFYAADIDPGPGPTSRLGPKTRAALEQFQQRQQPPIPTTPPFAVGPKTWAALERAGFR